MRKNLIVGPPDGSVHFSVTDPSSFLVADSTVGAFGPSGGPPSIFSVAAIPSLTSPLELRYSAAAEKVRLEAAGEGGEKSMQLVSTLRIAELSGHTSDGVGSNVR